jgi:hypothetical protein
MRSVVWTVLAGLGAFFIVLAITMRLIVPAQSVKFPLNDYSVSTLVANNASWFSPKSVSELGPVTLKITSTTQGDVSAAATLGSANYAVWQNFSTVEDVTDHQAVSIPAFADELAFNRKTGAIVPWSGNSVDGTHVSASGQAYVWPLGSKKTHYYLYDTTLGKPVQFTYAGTSTTSGIATYKYTANVPPTQVGTETLPGSLIGMKAASVTLPEDYSTQETYYVDPVTGAPLLVNRNTQTVLEDSSGGTVLVLLKADFQTSPASVAATVKTDNHYRTEIQLVTLILPIIAAVLGLILLVVGLVLSRIPPEDEQYEDTYEPVPSPA